MTGNRIRNSMVAIVAAIATWSPQVIAHEAQQVTVQHEGIVGPLHGTLLAHLGAENTSAVLIIPGSGPTNRDGNNTLGVRASTYRLLAEALAKKGISSLRIDKRGMFASVGAVADANDVTVGEYVADTRAWISKLREASGQDCVWLLGHSEGGLIALATVAADPSGICGLVMAASPGRPLGMALREQLEANPANAPILKQAEAAISALERGEDVSVQDLHPALLPLFAPQVQGFMRSLLAQDPGRMLADYKGPALILQPGEDLQTGLAEGQALAAANPAAKLVVLENVNHVLKQVPAEDRAANLATYANPDLPLADGVVQAIAEFVLENSSG
ncbi:alpha/beta fold hydrolase [Altererythrobacter sp. MF3-039]|uniref:alpha/beta fold hydrolase n=1 Tax=Altererythrobacter sp. MF3-039 TaxID=3252901 RepID=UPI00390C4D84